VTSTLETAERDGGVALTLSGRLDSAGVGPIWRRATGAAAKAGDRKLAVELEKVTVCDTAGAALLLAIEAAHRGPTRFEGAHEAVRSLLENVRQAVGHEAKQATARGQQADAPNVLRDALRATGNGIAYLGEAAVAFVSLPARAKMFRLRDLLRYMDQAGFSALPLTVLLGFLIGLILAFQSLVPMRRFGADLYVANLVSIALLRELGPLLAAVVLSGRTGSAFAAEIGTMKVNEEIDALVTMGLDPMTMLVLPRMAAAMLVMPGLAIVMDLAGLGGMSIVMMSFGFPFITIANQVQYASTTGDLFGGLFKSVWFGAAIAAVACRAGLATGMGPRAVGLSATAAVVGGIVITIVIDGMFAVLFNQAGM